MKSLLAALESRFKVLEVDAVVVRSMDWHPSRSKGDTAQKRYASDGVVLAVARNNVQKTAWLTGVAVGAKCGKTKQQIEVEAVSIAPKLPKEAVAAALAALRFAADS